MPNAPITRSSDWLDTAAETGERTAHSVNYPAAELFAVVQY